MSAPLSQSESHRCIVGGAFRSGASGDLQAVLCLGWPRTPRTSVAPSACWRSGKTVFTVALPWPFRGNSPARFARRRRAAHGGSCADCENSAASCLLLVRFASPNEIPGRSTFGSRCSRRRRSPLLVPALRCCNRPAADDGRARRRCPAPGSSNQRDGPAAAAGGPQMSHTLGDFILQQCGNSQPGLHFLPGGVFRVFRGFGQQETPPTHPPYSVVLIRNF